MGKGKMAVLFVIGLVALLATGCNEQVEQPKEAAPPADLETQEFALCVDPPSIDVDATVTAECDGALTPAFIDFTVTPAGQEGCDLFPQASFEYFDVGTNQYVPFTQTGEFPYGGTTVRVKVADRDNTPNVNCSDAFVTCAAVLGLTSTAANAMPVDATQTKNDADFPGNPLNPVTFSFTGG